MLRNMLKYSVIACLAILMVLSCSKEESGSTGGGGGTSTQGLAIAAAINPTGSFVYVGNGAEAYENALVVINGDTLEYLSGCYMSTRTVYNKGTKYVLYVDAGELGEFCDSLTAPANLEAVTVTSPHEGDTFPKNQPITVTWSYQTSNNDGVAGIVFKYKDEDEARYHTDPPYNGSVTSGTIPASAVNKDGNAEIYVWAGSFKKYDNLAAPAEVWGDYSYFAVGVESPDVEVVIGEGGGGGSDTTQYNWSGTWQGTIVTSVVPPESVIVNDGQWFADFNQYTSGDTVYLTGHITIYYNGSQYLCNQADAYGYIYSDSICIATNEVSVNGNMGIMVLYGASTGSNQYSGDWCITTATTGSLLPYGYGEWSGGTGGRK